VSAIASRKAGNADEKKHQQRCEPCQALRFPKGLVRVKKQGEKKELENEFFKSC
jgi:hypothetical protein